VAETYKIGTTDVTTYLTHLQIIDGSIGIPPMRQDDYVVPGRTGAVAATPWWGPRTVTFGGVVAGSSRAAMQANLKGLMSLVLQGGDTYTMTRTLDTLGTPATVTHTATARYLGGLEQVQPLSDKVAKVAFDVQLMDGFWYDQAYSSLGTASISGTAVVPALGDGPTQDIQITYSAGADTQRVTNTAYPGLSRLTVKPGNNTLVVSGGGSVTLRYKAAWL
jgi:hypothetical protein